MSTNNLLSLVWRILDEEIKAINKASKNIIGGKLVYAKDKTFLVRHLSRNKQKLLIRFAEKITDKKLSDIDFRENQIDQLAVRIILRKYLGKIIFRIGFARFYFKLMSVNIYLNKNSSTIAELFSNS
jgi:hypothetical protein